MDKKRAALNIITGLVFKVLLLIATLISTRFIILNLGTEINGIMALFSSIIGFLSIAELGVGSAITFSMYKPIVEKDYDKVSSLYYLYRKIYLIIMIIILVIGIVVSFFIVGLAKNYSSPYNLQITFILFLTSVVLTYLFAHKTSTINAFKDNYLVTTTNSIVKLSEIIIQIIVLVTTKNFVLFLLTRIIMVTIEMMAINYIFKKRYEYIINDNKKIEPYEKQNIIKNVKGLFFINIGAVLILSTDNIIISSVIGIKELGEYNLYITIISNLSMLLSLVFIEITSIIGQHNIKLKPEEKYENFMMIHAVNIILGLIFFSGYFMIINDLIIVIFKIDVGYSYTMRVAITITFFTDFIRRGLASYKNSMGLFYQERFRPMIEGILNLVISLLFVKIFGIIGVLIGTIITRLLVLFIMEPHVVFKYGFDRKSILFTLSQYLIVLIMIIISIINYFLHIDIRNLYLSILINGSISVAISMIFIVILYITSKDFNKSIKLISFRIFKKRKEL